MSTDEPYAVVEARQTYTGRLRCDQADAYTGPEPPTCLPLCETCLLKWLKSEELP